MGIPAAVILAAGVLAPGLGAAAPEAPAVFRLPGGTRVAYCRDAALAAVELRIAFRLPGGPPVKGEALARTLALHLTGGEGGTTVMAHRDLLLDLERLGVRPEYEEGPEALVLRYRVAPEAFPRFLGFAVDLLRFPTVVHGRLRAAKEAAARDLAALEERPLDLVQARLVDRIRGEGQGGLAPRAVLEALEGSRVAAAQAALVRPERVELALAGPLPAEAVRQEVEARVNAWTPPPAAPTPVVPTPPAVVDPAATVAVPAGLLRPAFALGLALPAEPRSAPLALAAEWLAWRAGQDPRGGRWRVQVLCRQGGAGLPAVLGLAAAPPEAEAEACRAQLRAWLGDLGAGVPPAAFPTLRRALVLREEARQAAAIVRAEEALRAADGTAPLLQGLAALTPATFQAWAKAQVRLDLLQTLATGGPLDPALPAPRP